ncbi:hypothetical protein FQN54_000086 [Arachnomyces sp. PD_36]|nr:hypothetical protein FQN54_000086 [Arachnomyces sp. PD_36]
MRATATSFLSALLLATQAFSIDVSVDVCKNLGSTDCFHLVLGAGTCNNLISSDGRPYVSGWLGPSTICTVYAEKDCSGATDGMWTTPHDFAIQAWSIECAIM